MKISSSATVVLVLMSLLVGHTTAQFGGFGRNNNRLTRDSPSADKMVQNILRWLEGAYTQNSRRSRLADGGEDEFYLGYPLHSISPRFGDDAFRQGTIKEYLPPYDTEKPHGFTPAPPGAGGVDEDGNFVDTGYPPAGTVTPRPPFPTDTQKPGFPTRPPPGLTEQPEMPGFPTERPEKPGFPTRPPPGLTEQPEKPGFPTRPPPGLTEQPEKPGFPTRPPPGLTEQPEKPGFPTGPPPGYPGTTGPQPGYPTREPEGPGYSYPTGVPGFPTPERPGQTTTPPARPGTTLGPEGTTGYPTTEQPTGTRFPEGEGTTKQPEGPGGVTTPGEGPGVTTPGGTRPGEGPSVTTPGGAPETTATPGGGEGPTRPTGTEPSPDEDRHPPHIHAIDVECGKEMMTINIEFNKPFNGIIYSKGYYNMPECRYVQVNSNQIKFTFTLSLNMCGTEFVNAFDTEGQSYLENVLVLQNEVGIQEVWDTVRSVRCLWEGNLKEHLSVSLMVSMLSQEIVTFSGDTAMAKLDILQGRGAFGQPANGLVKIGDPLTLVVSVSGDPGFDVQVKDCRATDTTGANTIPLTDDDGCILKPKLFGAFQKTRNTENTGASVIAFAYFNAFKFPDVMDLMIECNIELCKTDCEMCPRTDIGLEPVRRRRRRRRDTGGNGYNITEDALHDAVAMGKHLRVVLPEDLAATTATEVTTAQTVCMSTQSFVFGSSLLISLLTASCVATAYMWLKRSRTHETMVKY